MNAERQKAGFFSRAASLLTHNWGLKLLSLVLAIVIYYAIKTESARSGRTSQHQNDSTIFQSN